MSGFFLGIAVAELLFSWADSEILALVIAILGAASMAFLSIRHYDNIVIVATSLLGSYCFVRGFSLFLPGTFPSETSILDEIKNGSIQYTFYIYVAVCLLLSALGSVYQRKQRNLESTIGFIKLR